MANTTESAGRPSLTRKTSTLSVKSVKSATSAHSSHSKTSHSKSKSSSDQPRKSQPDSPISTKSSTEKEKEDEEKEKKREREKVESESAYDSASKTTPATPAPAGGQINMVIFDQILELDDDETREFSRSMVNDYYSQVDATLVKMDNALEAKRLKELSDLGHFLKGSSAALGVEKVQAACERVQHAGNLRDEEKGVSLTESEALELITDMLKKVKKDYPEARAELDKYLESIPV